MARGSNCEVATQLVIAEELDFGDQLKLDASAELSVEVGKMLNAMIKRLESPAAGVVKSPIPVP